MHHKANRMHVLIIPSEPLVTEKTPLGGIFQYEQAKALAKAGYRVGIVATGFISLRDLFSGYPYKKEEHGRNLHIVRAYKFSIIPRRFISPQWFQSLQIKLFKIYFLKYVSANGMPDIIHAHNVLFAGVIAAWIKREYGIPFLLTEHSSAFKRGHVPKKYNGLMQGVVESASFLTCVSTSFAPILQNRFAKDFYVLPNMVDELFFSKPLRVKGNNNYIFINAASCDENKNQQLILRSFALGFKGTSARLKIVGEGPLMSELMVLAKSLDVESQIIFLGRLSRHALCEEILNADCFVLSSNYETFGVVLIEALACGIPLIATKSGGPEDIVNQANGLLVDTCSVEQLGNAMKYMFKNSINYDPLILRNEAQRKFGEKSFISSVERFYSSICDLN